jgi:DNA phosphorothioation-dependent restriction protein DptG
MPQDQGTKDDYKTTSVHCRIFLEDIVLDQDCYQYLLKYLDKTVTFYHTGYLVVSQLVLTHYEINTEPPQSP